MTTITSFNDVLARLTPDTTPLHAPLFRALTKVTGMGHPTGRADFTAREWFEMHTGKRVDTAQLRHVGGFWAPLQREVSTNRKTYVELNGSRRDYAELKVIYADKDTLWAELYYGKDKASGAVVYALSN